MIPRSFLTDCFWLQGVEAAEWWNWVLTIATTVGYTVGNLVLMLTPWMHKHTDVEVLSRSARAAEPESQPSKRYCCGLCSRDVLSLAALPSKDSDYLTVADLLRGAQANWGSPRSQW